MYGQLNGSLQSSPESGLYTDLHPTLSTVDIVFVGENHTAAVTDGR
jgi:hypothetical protein